MTIKKEMLLFFICYGIILTPQIKLYATQEEKDPIEEVQLSPEAQAAREELLDCIAEEETAYKLNFPLDVTLKRRYELYINYYLLKNGQHEDRQKQCRYLQKVNLEKKLKSKKRQKIEQGINTFCAKWQEIIDAKIDEKIQKHNARLLKKNHPLIPRIHGNSDRTARQDETVFRTADGVLVPHKPRTPPAINSFKIPMPPALSPRNPGGEKEEPTPPKREIPMEWGKFLNPTSPTDEMIRGLTDPFGDEN